MKKEKEKAKNELVLSVELALERLQSVECVYAAPRGRVDAVRMRARKDAKCEKKNKRL